MRIGEYEVVDVGGVPLLRNMDTGIVNYYNAGAVAGNCGKWEDGKCPQALVANEPSERMRNMCRAGTIGAVTVEILEPGFYQFEYHLEPWMGDFARLKGA